MPEPVTLIVLPPSHFCEKARWGLERAGVSYRQDRYAPLFNRAETRKHGGTTTPVLVTRDGAVPESTPILRWAHDQGADLYPDEDALRAEIDGMEDTLQRLGLDTRRLVYGHLLQHPSLARKALGRELPRRRRAALTAVSPLLFAMMRKGLKIDAKGLERSRQRVDETLSGVEERLADGRRYLVGDRFTAADLTFAAMLAPIVLPSNYGARTLDPDERPAEFLEAMAEYRARPAGQFALRMFADHRNERASRA